MNIFYISSEVITKVNTDEYNNILYICVNEILNLKKIVFYEKIQFNIDFQVLFYMYCTTLSI